MAVYTWAKSRLKISKILASWHWEIRS